MNKIKNNTTYILTLASSRSRSCISNKKQEQEMYQLEAIYMQLHRFRLTT